MSKRANILAYNSAVIGDLAGLKTSISRRADDFNWIACDAAENGHLHIVEYLDYQYPNRIDYNDVCVYGISGGHEEVLKYALSKGANQFTRFAMEAICKRHFQLFRQLMPNLIGLIDRTSYIFTELEYHQQHKLVQELSDMLDN